MKILSNIECDILFNIISPKIKGNLKLTHLESYNKNVRGIIISVKLFYIRYE